MRNIYNVSFIFGFMFFTCTQLVGGTSIELDKDLQRKIKQQVNKELSWQVGSDKTAKKIDPKLERQIKQQVEKELKRETFEHKRDRYKQFVYAKKGDKPVKKPSEFVYKLPSWPFSALFYEQKDLFQFQLNFSEATQGYASGGATRDLSTLVFGYEPVLIQEILLVSKLAKKGLLKVDEEVNPGVWDYVHPDVDVYRLLADQEVIFDASTESIGGSLNFARHFRNGDLSFGFQVPFAVRKNSLKVTSDIDTKVRDDIKEVVREKATHGGAGAGTPTFSPDASLSEIVKQIVEAKGMSFEDHTTESGIGDITTFVHYEVPTKKFERMIFGLEAVFPTARERNFQELWGPEIGNGGFVQLGLFSAALFSFHRLFNPHMYGRVLYSFDAHVSRRVPARVIYDGKERQHGGMVPDDMMKLAENVTLVVGKPFDELDSTIRGFADNVRKVKIRKGPEFFFKFGNIFEQVFFKKAFLDLCYNLRIKGKDHLGFQLTGGEFDMSLWGKDTLEIEHNVGLDYSYQFDDQMRLALGGTYVFAGQNTPRTYEAHVALNVDF